MSDKNFNKISGALLVGLAFGALTGLLTAPKKGKETRKLVSNKIRDWLDKFQDNTQELEKRLKRIFGVVTKETAETYGRIKSEVINAISVERKDLTPGQYEKVVDNLVKKYQKKLNLAKGTMLKLKDDLMGRFK